MSKPPARQRDRKGRPYIPLGKFMGRYALQVYVAAPAKGERREAVARVVLAGFPHELRAAIDPYQAERLDRAGALLLLWDRLVHLVDEQTAPMAAADAYREAMAAEGLAPPPGPLHEPGVPRRVRLILLEHQANPTASHRTIAKRVGCDPGWVSKALRGQWKRNRQGADWRADSALINQRKVSAESAREHAPKTGLSLGENRETRPEGPAAESAPPPCTSSFLRKEDDGAPPPDATVPRAALEGPPRPVVAGHTSTTPPATAGEPAAPDEHQRRPGPTALEFVPDELRTIVAAVVRIEAATPGRATRWEIERNTGGRKADAALGRATELGYLAACSGGTAGSAWWEPKHARLIALVDELRATCRSAAS